MSGTSGDGGMRWNDETQRWESAGESGAVVPPTAPPPPVPAYAPPEPADPTYTVTPPPAPRPRSRRTTALIAGATVAVVAGSVAFGMLALRDDGAGDGTGNGAASAVSASATATTDTGPGGGPPDSGLPTETSSPTEPTDVPSGYTLQQDTAGFTVAVPAGWARQEKANGVFYNSPDGLSLVQIYTDREGSLTPYESLRQTSQTLRSANKNYRQLSLQDVPDGPGERAAELVYAYDRTDGSRRKVVDRAFVADNGTQYAVLVAGPEEGWPRQRETLQVALAYFAP